METFPLINDGKSHTLDLGESFKKNGQTAFHTMRLDFKPASVDENRAGKMIVKDKRQVEIVLPHQQNSKTATTVYRGSTKAAHKECFLIIDPETGNLTLERINSQIQAKKIRLGDDQKSSKSDITAANIAPTPRPIIKRKMAKSVPQKKPARQQRNTKLPTKVINPSPASAVAPPHKSQDVLQMPTTRFGDYVEEEDEGSVLQLDELLENIAKYKSSDSGSDSSSSSSSSSSDDSDDDVTTSPTSPKVEVKTNNNVLEEDLELSSDDSETD